MKSLQTIQKLFKIGKILSRIAFIFSVIGFCGCIAGLLSLSFGNGSLIKLGGVTLHQLISEVYGYNIKGITASLSGWLSVPVKQYLQSLRKSTSKMSCKPKRPSRLPGRRNYCGLAF